MFRNGMCSPSWMPINQQVSRNSNNICHNNPVHHIEYLSSYCIDQTTAAQLAGVNTYSEFVSLYPYDYGHCSTIGDKQDWVKILHYQANHSNPSRKSKFYRANKCSRLSSPEPFARKCKSLSPEPRPVIDYSRKVYTPTGIKVTKEMQTNSDNSVTHPVLPRDNTVSEKIDACDSREIFLAGAEINQEEGNGDGLVKNSRGKKRKHPSEGNQSGSAVATKHQLTSTHMRERNVSSNLNCADKSVLSKNWDKISLEMWDLFNETKQTPDLLNRKMFLRYTIYKTIRAHCPIDLYIVGSSLNGLGSNKSDIDLCLVLKNSSEDMNHMTYAIPVLKCVKTILADLSFVKNLELITAKVPILKFTDTLSGIEVDLNVNNIVGIRNTQLIECYTRMDWRVQPLVLVLKKWARENGINDAHNKTISSYTLVLMVIHFLQCGCYPPVLPCLHQLMPDDFKSDSDITTLDLFVELPKYESKNNQSIGDLCLDFLNYYGYKFQYNTDAISIRTGGTIPKYVAREHRSPKNTPTQWKYICVEEPFERTNTARSVYDEAAFLCIIEVFRRSYIRLKNTQIISSIMSPN